MVAFLQDSFDGAASTPINGRTPDITFLGELWHDGPWVYLSGDGAALPTGAAVNNSNDAYIGDFVTDYGNPLTYDAYFSWKSGPDVSAGSLAHKGVQIDLRSGSKQTQTKIYTPTTNGVWVLSIGLPGGTAVTNPITIAPNTKYDGVISIANGAQSVTVNGVTCAIATAFSSAIGCNSIGMTIGGTTRMLSLSVGGPMPAAVPVTGYGTAPSPLGLSSGPAALGTAAAPVVTARASVVSPLGAARALARHDFTSMVGGLTVLYVMDLITPGGAVRVPISSWQATLQTGSSNYVQCVVPACLPWVDDLNTATEFVVYRHTVLPSGAAFDYEMARAPAGQVQFDRGTQRYTCTLSGYSTAFLADANPPAAYDRVLTGVRSISSGSLLRVRCAVDWLLRPGHRAFVDGSPFVVGYINYYAPSGFDAYMDVGEQG